MTSKELDMLQKTLMIICEDIQDIKLQLQKISYTQEYQASDIEKHIKRTDLLQQHLSKLEKAELTCPARLNTQASKTVVTWAKDISVLVGLVLILLKVFGVWHD